MLKYLTHKLRTQSINEENNVHEKIDGHDSGTESDDGDVDPKDEFNENEMELSVNLRPETTPSICSSESPFVGPSNLLAYDQNSSEEELEVINGPNGPADARNAWPDVRMSMVDEVSPKRCSSTILEKRKRSLAHSSDEEVRHLLEQKQQQHQQIISAPVNFRTSPPLEALKPHRSHMKRSTTPLVLTAETTAARSTNHQRGSISSSGCGSLGDISIITPSNSGDNIAAISLISISPLSISLSNNNNNNNNNNKSPTTSPISNLASATTNVSATTTNYCDNILNCNNINHQIPNHSHPTQSLVNNIPMMDVRSTSPPTKKKSRHHHPQRLQRSYRPCLDFDKMQQLKARSVTTWRHSNEHNELSVFCW